MQHVEFEWDFYPARQRAYGVALEATPDSKESGRDSWGGGGENRGWPRVTRELTAHDCEESGTGSLGHECLGDEGYLCKSPSLASKKFTVYLTDLAIRIRMSNVSCKMTDMTQLVLQIL
jgi:hypothetical protein